MIEVDKVILTEDIKDEFFVCDLGKCKGACCVEGYLGAPLEEVELHTLDEIYQHVEPFLSEKAKKVIAKQGKYVYDNEGDYSTPTLDGKECAYAVYNKAGILTCGIEVAHNEGKINYQKPISCHLYPLRVKKYAQFEAVNYDRWHICKDACSNGMNLRVPLYKFLQQPLARKYGESWYKKLVSTIENNS